MRLLPRAAAIWQQASPRFALNLVPFRLLARPVAPISTTFPHIKCLHDDTKKKPDSAAEQAAKNPQALGDDSETTAVEKRKKWGSDAQLAHNRKLIETQRANDFPNLKKAWEASRAAGFPNAKQSLKNQRAAGFPNAKKGRESQRAAGFPNMRKYRETQRASGWADLKRYHAEQQALGYLESRQRYHAELLRNIEVANQRRLAEDPTFIPPALPDLDSRPRVRYPPRRSGTIPCPEPGCNSKLSNERTLAIHIQRKHSYYSMETSHKCKDPSCNKYFPTEKKALAHLNGVHRRRKPPCPVCDRIFSSPTALKQHLLQIHGIQPSPA